MSRDPQRRLLIRPGAIGDCILAFPQMEAVRAGYTEVWAPRPILPLIGFADRTRAIIDTGLDFVGVLPEAKLAAIFDTLKSFDSIYSWYGSARPEFRDAVRHLPFTFFPALPPPLEGVPRIRVPAAPRRRFAVVHPFSSSLKKTWPMEKFRALSKVLDRPVMWTAGPEESLPGDLLQNSVRFADLYELGCWISTASVYIGNDSGISHLAAAVGTPVVAIFQASDPRIWAPRGSHVRVLENPTVEEAREAVG